MPHIPNIMTFDYDHLDHAHLIRVVPVGVTRTAGDIACTLMSLELYEAGFIALLLIEQSDPEYSGEPDQLPVILNAIPTITARDDTGQTYAGRPRAGAGGGSARGSQMHEVYVFAPALNPDARSLSLTIDWVERPGWNADGSPTWSAVDVVASPKTLTFPIEGGPPSRS